MSFWCGKSDDDDASNVRYSKLHNEDTASSWTSSSGGGSVSTDDTRWFQRSFEEDKQWVKEGHKLNDYSDDKRQEYKDKKK